MSLTTAPFRSVFAEIHDVIIFGGGYAGVAAAMELAQAGRKVLLVERRAALVTESAWSFASQTGQGSEGAWTAYLDRLAARGGMADGLIDGAIAEVITSERFRTQGIAVLYYAMPIAAIQEDGLLHGIIVGTKGGCQRLLARQWIDATETGELAALLDRGWKSPVPASKSLNLYFRHTDWKGLPLGQVAGSNASVQATVWPNERCLHITLPGGDTRAYAAWVPAMRALREAYPQAMDLAVLTHGSTIPFCIYGGVAAGPKLPANVGSAIASTAPSATLAERFANGLATARGMAGRNAANPGNSAFALPTDWTNWQVPAYTAEVAVAGIGTGGAMAAVAAAREGAKTLAFDPLPFAGGIGAGGGIHWYYFGMRGGLQDELDERMRQIMPLFGKTSQVMGFHPDAKKVVLEQLLHEAGAQVLSDTMLVDTHTEADGSGMRISAALIGRSEGPAIVRAQSWIDGTGDGDLAAASRQHRLGRTHDGLLHAYSQSSGRAAMRRDGSEVHLWVVNYDAGWVDPTDSQDLTRARLHGISHYLQEQYTEAEHPTYIAPAIGLRQGRQIATDYQITLADLIERRRFSDAVGLTGCHYDNHATDYEFESDEAMFWVWVCEQWRGRTACQMPYRMVLPTGLTNVLICCRAAGVTEEAHHSLRMQRDFQRLGEVCGVAAALSVKTQRPTREVPLEQLQTKLAATGAMSAPSEAPAPATDAFGPRANADAMNAPDVTEEQLAKWLSDLEQAHPGPFLWYLYRNSTYSRPAITKALSSANATTSWRAAAILAMWSDASAEPRLMQSVREREYGFDASLPDRRPEPDVRVAPHWMVSIVLLRRCGTAACLRTLYDLACDSSLIFNARTAIAITCQMLSSRLKLNDEQKDLVAQTLRKLLAGPYLNSAGGPQKNIAYPPTATPKTASPTDRVPVVEDYTWQLHLAVAKAEESAGLPLHPEIQKFRVDPRGLVRRAFSRLTENY